MSRFVKTCEKMWKNDRRNKRSNNNWTIDDAAVYVAAWLDWHGTVDAVPGLRDALKTANSRELTVLRQQTGVSSRFDKAGIK